MTYSSASFLLNNVGRKPLARCGSVPWPIQNCIIGPGIHPRKPITHGRLPVAINSATCAPERSLSGTSPRPYGSLKSPNVIMGKPASLPLAEDFKPHQSPLGSITTTRLFFPSKCSTLTRNAEDFPAPVLTRGVGCL